MNSGRFLAANRLRLPKKLLRSDLRTARLKSEGHRCSRCPTGRARRTLSSLQAATAGQWIGRQDRRGELQPFALRCMRRENHPLDGFLTRHIPAPGAPIPAPPRSRSEPPARADGRAGPTACGRRYRPPPPVRSTAAPPRAERHRQDPHFLGARPGRLPKGPVDRPDLYLARKPPGPIRRGPIRRGLYQAGLVDLRVRLCARR